MNGRAGQTGILRPWEERLQDVGGSKTAKSSFDFKQFFCFAGNLKLGRMVFMLV